ncbi:uncharacterized protein LOC113562388 isoform X3 [Ooceraea biroi]|nr:uncharacterized protein LOC105287358 isoform X3 [Ooceraea biroi]XP_026827606.1 uncharacterized protein LOC113562388 isoform X3 [Ooceraea biroi]
MEAELKRMNTLLEEIVRHQRNRDRPNQVRKPRILPISSIREMDAFEGATDDIFFDTVNYFRYIGGFNLKEAVNLCFKEALSDSLTPSYTWWGREEGQRPLYNARFIVAIYGTVLSISLYGR